MAGEFRFRAINHSDRPLQTLFPQALCSFPLRLPQVEAKGRKAGLMAAPLVTLRHGRSYSLDFHRPIPIRRRSDGAGISAKPDHIALITEFFSAQMPEVVFAARHHLGGCRIAAM